MATQQFTTGDSPAIRIARAHSDLVIRGWQRPEVLVKSDENFDAQQSEGAITLGFDDDAVLSVPFGCTLQIVEVDGDLAIQGIAGGVSIGKGRSAIDIREVGPLRIEGVDDDLSVRTVRGDCWVGGVGNDANVVGVQGTLTIHGVGNDASISGVLGDATISGVGDDLQLQDVLGSVKSNVGGDADLRIAIAPNNKYEIRAGGDVSVRIQSGASVGINITSGGAINVRNVDGATQKLSHNASFNIGTAEAHMNITAGGEVTLRGVDMTELKDPYADFGAEFGAEFGNRAADFAQSVVTQIEAQVGNLGRQLEEKMSAYGTNEEMATKLQEKIQSTLRKAEERLSEALRNVEIKVNDVEMGKRKGYVWPPPPPPAPKPPKPTRTAATDEERAMVLRMVSEGKISVEQAEKLLTALNSGDD